MNLQPVFAETQAGESAPPNENGHKRQRDEGQEEICFQHQGQSTPKQSQQKEDSQKSGVDEHPDPFNVQNSQGDQISCVHMVVITEGELRELFKVLHPQLIAHVLANGFS